MDATYPFQMAARASTSPAGALSALIAAELAAGSIPAGCPHPVTADRLHLPSRTLRCVECADQAGPDSRPGPCASCGADGAASWTTWMDEASRVLVIARVCQDCLTAGAVPVSMN